MESLLNIRTLHFSLSRKVDYIMVPALLFCDKSINVLIINIRNEFIKPTIKREIPLKATITTTITSNGIFYNAYLLLSL